MFTHISHTQPSLGLCFLLYLHLVFQILNCFPYLFSLLFLDFIGYLWEISSFLQIFVCYLHFFMAVFHHLFKFLYHFLIVPFKVDFFYFFWRMVFKSSCWMITGIWCCHVAFQIIGGILALVPAQLLLQMQPGESLHWSKLCCVILSASPQCRSKNCSLVLWVCVALVLEQELHPIPWSNIHSIFKVSHPFVLNPSGLSKALLPPTRVEALF